MELGDFVYSFHICQFKDRITKDSKDYRSPSPLLSKESHLGLGSEYEDSRTFHLDVGARVVQLPFTGDQVYGVVTELSKKRDLVGDFCLITSFNVLSNL